MADAVFAAISVALLFCGLVAGCCLVVHWARRRSRRAYVIGAVLAPFMTGNVVDPDFRIVQEAKQLKKREEDDSGDPPAPEDEQH